MGTSRWLLRWSVPMLVVGSATSDPYPRNPDLDILAYRYVLALSDSSDQIRMDATVEFGFLAGGRTRLSLDLVGRNDSGKGMVVDRVADSAGPLEFSHRDNRLDVALRRPGSAGERGAVSIRYHGPAAALTIGAIRPSSPTRARTRSTGALGFSDQAGGLLRQTAPNSRRKFAPMIFSIRASE